MILFSHAPHNPAVLVLRRGTGGQVSGDGELRKAGLRQVLPQLFRFPGPLTVLLEIPLPGAVLPQAEQVRVVGA